MEVENMQPIPFSSMPNQELYFDESLCDYPFLTLRAQCPYELATWSVAYHKHLVPGLTYVGACLVHPRETVVVVATSQAGRFQAFHRVYKEFENGNIPRLLSLSPSALKIVETGRRCKEFFL
jgi:hypothetical protein